MLNFASAVLFLIITPGPGVLSAAGVGASFGWAIGSRYIAGLWFGNLVVGLLVISGVWTLAAAIPGMRILLGLLSLLFLIYLAICISLASKPLEFAKTGRSPGFTAGALLQLINPKAYAVNTFLFSNFAFWPHAWILELLMKLLILNLIVTVRSLPSGNL